MSFRKPIFILFALFSIGFEAFAQDQNGRLSLKMILSSIEKQHQITFNYLENDVIDKLISAPEETLSLADKVLFIQKNTNLSFENTSEGFYVISRKIAPEITKICGYIYSRKDNSVLENANIISEDGNTTTANSKGFFEINKSNLYISYIGYKSKKISLDAFQKKECLNIYLESKSNELIEVMANRYLTSGITKTTEGRILLKPKKLGILPGLIEADILLAMQQIPGINSSDESVSSINVRGGTNDQNLFLWNGIKMYQTGHFFGLISAFNPNLAQTISISKNGSSAFYGESVSSVVDINSTPTMMQKNTFSAGLNMINADVYGRYNLNTNGFIELAGRKSTTEFLQTPTYQEYFDKAFQNTIISNFSGLENTQYSNENKFGFYDASLKYFQNIGKKNTLVLDLITINDQLDVMQKTIFNNTNQSEQNVLIQKNYGGNVALARDWNPKNKSKLAIYGSYYNINADKTKVETKQVLLQENSILDTGIRFENKYLMHSKLELNYGLQFNETGVTNLDQINNPIFLRQIKEVLRTQAFIFEAKFKDSINNLTLNVGLRSNYFEKFNKTLLEPRLQFNYGFAKNMKLEILGELKSQTSFQIIDLQNDYFGIEKRRWILANDSSIPIQKSRQIATNITFTENNWLVSFENFYKKVSGINSSGQGFQNQLEFAKINGSYSIFGTELLIQKKINNFLSWLSYSYNDNKYNFDGIEPSLFSNNYNIKHTINWAAIFEKNNFKLALGSKWSSGKPITTPSSTTINATNPLLPKIDYNHPNNSVLNSFFQINFSTTYKWKNSKNTEYKLGFAVLNIFNKVNEINEYYRINSINNSIEDVKTFALKRTPNLSFRIVF